VTRTGCAVRESKDCVGSVRASNCGAGIGKPTRFPNAAAAYRAAGLVPTLYESAGRARGRQRISREGSVDLRAAIIELGRGLSQHEDDSKAYRRRLLDAKTKPSVAAVAVEHRAAMAKTNKAHQNNVTGRHRIPA
jgi:transposase